MKKIIIIVLTLITLNVNANTKETIKFKRCVDGDTAIFIINNEETRVRFLAIDTPETVHPTKEVEKYGKNASEYTCNRITNAKKIEIEYDDGSTKVDKYNRTLGWIYVDGNMLQEELVKIGYASVKYIYGKYKYTEKLYEVEEEAKKQKLGIWNDYEGIFHTVTYKYDNEEIKVEIEENTYAEDLNIEKEGYTFDGWYKNDKKFNFKTKITKDITLTAKYTKNYTTSDYLILLIIIIILYLINPKKLKKKLKKLI